MLKPAWNLVCSSALFAMFFYLEQDIAMSIYLMLVFVGAYAIFSNAIDLLFAAAARLWQAYKERN